MNEPERQPWWFSPMLRWLLWLACLAASTAVLIGPSLTLLLRRQIDDGPNSELDQQLFFLSKAFHIGDYALLAVLTAWLPASRRLRALLLVVLSAHAAGTEFLQQFVETRTGTWLDVGLDHLGLVLGMALTWKWWVRPVEMITSPPATDTEPASSAAQ
jgi:VanZ family protein